MATVFFFAIFLDKTFAPRRKLLVALIGTSHGIQFPYKAKREFFTCARWTNLKARNWITEIEVEIIILSFSLTDSIRGEEKRTT